MEVAWFFAGPDESWRNREFILDRDGNPSFSRSVQLGNHQPGETDGLLEFSGLHQSVTSSGRIHHDGIEAAIREVMNRFETRTL